MDTLISEDWLEAVIFRGFERNLKHIRNFRWMDRWKKIQRSRNLMITWSDLEQLQYKQLQQLQNATRWIEQIQKKISSARKISRETSKYHKTKEQYDNILYLNMIFLYNALYDWSRESCNRVNNTSCLPGINILSNFFGNLGIFHSKNIQQANISLRFWQKWLK